MTHYTWRYALWDSLVLVCYAACSCAIIAFAGLVSLLVGGCV